MHQSSMQVGITTIKKFASQQAPRLPGVYKMLSAQNEILYIGKAKNLAKRIRQYANTTNMPNRLCRMVSLVRNINVITTETESQALLLEATLIRQEKPPFNIELKDDKTFPYIMIDDRHEFPRISKYRGVRRKETSLYGPYSTPSFVEYTIKELQKIFRIRPCSDSYFAARTRPCLQYQINKCCAPCVGKVTTQEYAALIKDSKDFLSGKTTEIQNNLKKEMQKASDLMDYEKAAQIRDKIKILTQVQSRNLFDVEGDFDIIAIEQQIEHVVMQVCFVRDGKNFGDKAYFVKNKMHEECIAEKMLLNFYQQKPPAENILCNADLDPSFQDAIHAVSGMKVAISMPKRGSKKDMLDYVVEKAKASLNEHIASRISHAKTIAIMCQAFGLDAAPERIEIYDNSHIQGTSAVGCMVVASPEGFVKDEYRKYNIQLTDKPDDYAMMREVLTRRFKKLNAQNHPDIMLLDGGAGHLSTAQNIMQEMQIEGIVLICIAKGEKRNAGRETFYMPNRSAFQLPFDSDALYYLQRLRDEVHRYAITSHRNKRKSSMSKSALDGIDGIGRSRKITLLQHFGSLDSLKNATVADIARAPGIGLEIARKIYNGLHSI